MIRGYRCMTTSCIGQGYQCMQSHAFTTAFLVLQARLSRAESGLRDYSFLACSRSMLFMLYVTKAVVEP